MAQVKGLCSLYESLQGSKRVFGNGDQLRSATGYLCRLTVNTLRLLEGLWNTMEGVSYWLSLMMRKGIIMP